MGRQESPLKSKLMLQIAADLPYMVTLRHEDVRTSGIPDLTTTSHGRTCWWEIKHGTPHFDSSGIQELTCLRLAAAGFCRYIIYIEDEHSRLSKRTLIVHPRNIKTLEPEVWCVKFDHRFVVDYMKRVHQL